MLNALVADHLPCYLLLGHLHGHFESTHTAKPNSFAPDKYASQLKAETWQHGYETSNPEEAYTTFIRILRRHINEAGSTTTKKPSIGRQKFRKPWMNKSLLQAIAKRKKAHSKHLKSPTDSELASSYRRIRNQTTKLLRETKSNFYVTELNECGSDQTKKWRIIKELLGKQTGLDRPRTLRVDGKDITDPKSIADNFNKFFVNIGPDLARRITHTVDGFEKYLTGTIPLANFSFKPATKEQVSLAIAAIDRKKAAGSDGINGKHLKLAIEMVSDPLTYIFNLCVSRNEFPTGLKHARVIPIFKKGNPNETGNYRPISILPLVSKIFERLFAAQIHRYMEFWDLFATQQFGFRRKRNTTQAILHITERIMADLDKKKPTIGVFIDFSKAFDTIDHSILCSKLAHYGFSPTAVDTIRSYLSERTQVVDFGVVSSDPARITCGVPQGSILGPLLFIIYVNDIIQASPLFSYVMYADDTNIFLSHSLPYEKVAEVNNGLSQIFNWCNENKLTINILKTNYIIFKFPNQRVTDLQLQLNGTQLDRIKNTKFLGLVIDEHLIWKEQVAECSRKIRLNIFVMKELSRYLKLKDRVNLYYTLIYPHLIYGLEVWGRTAPTHLNRILIDQKYAIRTIHRVPILTPSQPLFQSSAIFQIHLLLELKLYQLIHNIIHNPSYQHLSTQLILRPITHQHPTRSREHELFYIDTPRTNPGQRTLQTMGTDLWNKLPKNIRNNPSHSSFKKGVARILAGLR